LLRAINASTILELIRRTGPVSRPLVARDSGLSKSIVSLSLVALPEAGWSARWGAPAGRGLSAVLYELDPQASWVAGIDVGRRWVRAALADITARSYALRQQKNGSQNDDGASKGSGMARGIAC
jgi:hypothetical protein